MADDPTRDITAPESASAPSTGARERKKHEARNRILDAWIALMVDGSADLNHDSIAAEAGVARRTVYRYFPDRDQLMEAAWTRVRELAGPHVIMPADMDELIATLRPIYTGFDKIARIATVVRATSQGRALRLAQKARRMGAYTAACAEAVKNLPAKDRVLATAIFQMLHTTPWLEMRDHWDLPGEEIARGMKWVVETLIADLKRRGDEDLG